MGNLHVDVLAELGSGQNNYSFLKNICSTFNLFNLVKELTRIDKRKGFHSKAALDHVFVNIPESTEKIIEPHLSVIRWIR